MTEETVKERYSEMTYNEYRKQFKKLEEFEKDFSRLSAEEVRALLANEKAGATVKACIFQTWKTLSGKSG